MTIAWMRILQRLFSFLLVMFACTFVASATKHTILFGGTTGFAYDPSFLTATVGDTIEWKGEFASHPLSSDAIPPGAAGWHVGTGTSFQYVPTIPGTYQYICDFHAPAMAGSFDVSAVTGVVEEKGMVPAGIQLDQNYPNPFNPETIIRYQLSVASGPFNQSIINNHESLPVTLKVYDALGREIATLVNEVQSPGVHQVIWNGAKMSSGIYFYRLTAGSLSDSRRMILLR